MQARYFIIIIMRFTDMHDRSCAIGLALARIQIRVVWIREGATVQLLL